MMITSIKMVLTSNNLTIMNHILFSKKVTTNNNSRGTSRTNNIDPEMNDIKNNIKTMNYYHTTVSIVQTFRRSNTTTSSTLSYHLSNNVHHSSSINKNSERVRASGGGGRSSLDSNANHYLHQYGLKIVVS